MSWDAVILKIQGPFRPIEEVADEDYLPLGSIESVAERVRAAFPGAEWSSATWASWGLDDDTGVTIDLEGVDSSNSILVSVSGSGNPIPHLLALARANDWVVLDCSTTEFLNADEVSSEGWEGYQSLLGGLEESIPSSGDQGPPQIAPPTPPQTAPPTPPLTPPRTRKKKKAAKKVKRKVKRQTAAKKSQPKKTSSRKKSPKKKSSRKNPRKKRPKKKK